MVAGLVVALSVDASELERDLERIEDGELKLPTVSAVRISCDGAFQEDVPVFIQE